MSEGMEGRGRMRAQGIALLFITFLVGVLSGFAAERVRTSQQEVASGRPGQVAPRHRPGHLPPMFRRLDLTEHQRGRIVEIIEEGKPRTDAIMAEMLPRLRSVTDSIHVQIRGVLTAEQAERWDSLQAEMHGRRRMMRPGMRGPGPPDAEPDRQGGPR